MMLESHKLLSKLKIFSQIPHHYYLALAILIVIVLHLPLSIMPLGRDQGIWSMVGLAMGEGKIFFKDILHFNLPGLGFAYAIADNFSSDPRVTTMLLNMTASVLIVLSLYLLLGATVSKAAASWASLSFAIIWPTYVDYWSMAQKDFIEENLP